MRIALICEYFYPDNSGSTPTDLSDLMFYLKQHHGELRIDVITSKNLYRPSGLTGKLARQENRKGVMIQRLRTPKSKQSSTFLRLLAGIVFSSAALFHLLRQPTYDLVLIVTNPPANGMAAWMYAKLRSVPYFYIIHDLYPEVAVAMGRLKADSIIVRLLKRMQKAWLNGATQVIALGRCMEQYLHQFYGVPTHQITVIPNWADPASITVSERHPENEFGRRHQLSGFVALYAGNFSHYVNFDQILTAARILKEETGITFLLVGDGVRRQEILDRIAREQLTNVRVLPKVPRATMNQVLAVADASLISLDPKMLGLGVPSKLYSSLASGRPVVAMVPDQSEVAAVLKEENCGINLSDGDSEALAAALKHLRQNPGLAVRMGRHGREALERRFTLSHAAAQFWSLIAGVTPAEAAPTVAPEHRSKVSLHRSS